MSRNHWLLAGVAIVALVGSPASAQAITPEEAAALRAQIAALQAQVDALESRLDAAAPATPSVNSAATPPAPAVAATAPAATPAPASPPPVNVAWRGAPEFSGEGGWTFKPRGRIHFDVGNVSIPGALATTRNLGTNARFRRVRLGAEGTMPGGLGFKLEVDFANAATNFGDAFVSYDFAPGLQLRLGNFETLQGMEQIASSNNNSFLERAAFNDAYLNGRRLGGAVAWKDSASEWRVEAGLFAAHSVDGSFDNDGSIIAGRLSYSPETMGGRLHFGINGQIRDFSSNANGAPTGGANQPSVGQLARYRARPNSQLTDVRFVDTGNFAATGDTIVGLEAAAIFPGFYASGEAQWLNARSYRPGTVATGLDGFGGANSAVVAAQDPGFFGYYAELGWFITGETRAFRNGTWSRTRVLNPVARGGSGAFQLMARIDHINLNDDALQAGLTNDFTTGGTSLAGTTTRLGRGGAQTGYLLGFNWYASDYVRFMVNYGRINVEGGPLAALVLPASTDPVNQRDYSVDSFVARLQMEF
jgi:phosphate-selective porin OprO/OprP